MKSKVSGDFPGSPVHLEHIFEINDDRITCLEIRRWSLDLELKGHRALVTGGTKGVGERRSSAARAGRQGADHGAIELSAWR